MDQIQQEVNNGVVDWRTVPLNFYLEMKGWLAHDNTLSDRICTKCGRFANSYKTTQCVNCDSNEFDYLRLPDGTAYCVSEGAFFLVLTKGTEEKWKADLAKYTKYLVPKFGFKIRSDMVNGVLQPPVNHQSMRKGAMIHLTLRNHPWYDHGFDYQTDPAVTRWPGRKGVQHIFHIRPNYGDTIKILKEAEVGKSLIAKDGSEPKVLPITPQSIDDPNELRRIFLMCAQKLGVNTQGLIAPQAAPITPPVAPPVSVTASRMDEEYDYPDPNVW